MELEYGAKSGSYHMIWEVDEILVVVLRYLLDSKMTILNISLTSKRINQCLRSTTLWKNLGFSFYNHNDTFASQEMLWHLLQERQLEFHLPDLKFEKVDFYLNNIDALKFIVVVTRSEKEAHALRIPPLKELVEMHDRPDIQELSCLLLQNLFAYTDLVPNSLRDSARALFDLVWIGAFDKPEASSLLRVTTGVLASTIFPKMKKYISFWGLTPLLFKLMQHSDRIVQASAFTIAADQAVSGATTDFVNHPLLLTTVTNGLDHEYQPIRRQAARMLSNLVKRSSDMQRAVMTEEMFQKLLTIRSDSETLNEVLFVFVHATSLEMTDEHILIWQKYYPNILELCQKQLRRAVDAAEDIVHKRVVKPDRKTAIRSALDSIEYIVKRVIIDLPNKEIILQNLIDSELGQLLRNTSLRKLYPSVLVTLRLITGEP